MKEQTIGTFKNDTFKNLMRQYSCERMSRDRGYRKEVLDIVAQRESAKRKEETKVE